MSKSTYFQQMGHKIGTFVPVLTPPRYMARRMEIAQFETFAQTGADLPLSQVNQQAKPQTVTDHAPGVKDAEYFSVGGRLHRDAQLLPAAASGLLDDMVELGPNGELTREKLSKHEEPRLPLVESSHTGTLERTPFLPITAGNSSLNELARGSSAKKSVVTGDIADQSSAKEMSMENSLQSPTDPDGLRYAHRNDGTAKLQPNAAINEGKIPAMMESLQGTKQKSKLDTDNGGVRIGILEITVVSPPHPTKQAKTDSAPNKLSWSRGISRGYGLRQG